jgi:hypothetical protein
MSVNVIASVTSATVRSKLTAIREMTKVRRRKSKASSVHPRKLAMKVRRAGAVRFTATC